MSAYRLTPAAQRDLSSIWDYTCEHWDENQAETYVHEVRNAIERIAEVPDRGQAVDELRAGYRRYAIGRHVIYFIVRRDGVDVIRILHQRMDPTRHL
ncbi:MAG: type II toxin-antitoxin system RelE/ParE family toxin [Actinomycetales bacterium]